jgi:hypothetical protein
MNTHSQSVATTLREYRMNYPWTASVPTLTQNRMLWVLLDRQSQIAEARARWRARLAAVRYIFAHPWRALNGE